MKKCSKCKSTKELNYFRKTKQDKDGYCSWCKDCEKDYKATRKDITKEYNDKCRATHQKEKRRYTKNGMLKRRKL